LPNSKKQISGALDACYAEKTLLDILKREQELKEFLQKQEARSRSCSRRRLSRKPTRRRRRAIQRIGGAAGARETGVPPEAGARQAGEREAGAVEEAGDAAQEAQLKEMMQKEKELADAQAPKQENLVSEIAKDTVYAVGQAADAVREASMNPAHREGEAREFSSSKAGIGDYMQSDGFRKETAERKEILISEKFAEQQQREGEIGGRPDDFGYRAQMQKDLEALHDSALLVVKHEQEQRKQEQQLIDQLKQDAARAAERVENSGREQDAIKAELDRIAKLLRR